ncbi:hypothetical protein PV396_30535 [Streptomyces sp. ME02-8801-2C]|uniref:hypothetical protein n=1 Tax=Streptomyces sp. ME02-8801-2C TaxID=3028680 RepID=UPI0029B59AC4|nr:hypothetical protein [Streptomyces sp. ME02-8801-2C]MDX3456227.1 hypothetical protein [Streptomyces sp. ME02-8801-2C]
MTLQKVPSVLSMKDWVVASDVQVFRVIAEPLAVPAALTHLARSVSLPSSADRTDRGRAAVLRC